MVTLDMTYSARYACPLCGKQNESLAEKKRHMRRVHPKVKKAKR